MRVAFRSVRGRRVFLEAPKAVEQKLGDFMDATVKPHFIGRFDEIVADWKHKVEFKARKYITNDSIKLAVYPTGPNKEIWVYVSEGTRRHTIRARNAPVLAFMWGGVGSYRPKTKPGSGIAGPSFRGLGKVVGGEMHFPREVHHPGSEGRHFPEFIAKAEKDWYSREMENAWRRIIREL